MNGRLLDFPSRVGGERIEYAMQMKWKRPLQGYLSVMLMFLFSNRLIELEWNRFKK